ncbi:MAG: RdgB/HAM1 family non-canonical purine NTP pyrophosphatase [Propionibacteriaceae bacterium]|jgi:XTP/dITP diphosphohydrolase|nr:RdgB/HAM1 family non-canonical purine NTP pyrophosphatase [Propionibacteriaceae bacterium]
MSPADPRVVVLATHNAKKGVELQRIFDAAGLPVRVVGLDELAAYPEPAETERDFAGNALIKARAAAQATGQLAVADDSGIAVDLLNGMPGVRSARWAGIGKGDEANLRLLIDQLADTDYDQRTARFVCAMALVEPGGGEFVATGEMPGRLVLEPRGANGFGYDPIFVADEQPPGQPRTNAELSPEEKDAISHRAKAAGQVAARLRALLGGGS